MFIKNVLYIYKAKTISVWTSRACCIDIMHRHTKKQVRIGKTTIKLLIYNLKF